MVPAEGRNVRNTLISNTLAVSFMTKIHSSFIKSSIKVFQIVKAAKSICYDCKNLVILLQYTGTV